MRKIRKRVLAVALAAVMLVHIPGTASYAEQAAGDVETTLETAASAEMAASVEVTASAETEPEEDGSEDIPETAADTGNGLEPDAEKPEKEETAPSEGEGKGCDCVALCTEDSVNGDCPVCGAEGADLSACRGEEQNNVPDNDKEDGTDTAQCICGIACTEDSINGDCPVCGAEGADLSVCEGTAYEGGEKEEETTEAAEPEEAETEDINLCAHHKEHTQDCGFVPATEDSEGSPCTYACRICPIEDLIAALPDEVTADNAEDVRARLDDILALYAELTEEEQGQIDLSRCYELQEALDEANAPMPLVPGDFDLSENKTVKLTAEDCGDNCLGHTITYKGTLPVLGAATILVESGNHNITFSNLNLTTASVGVMPGGTMNLTLTGENKIQSSDAGIYVPKDATLIIGGDGSLDVSGGVGGAGGAGIGGSYWEPGTKSTFGDTSCGEVIINSGTITATGGYSSAGIGGAGGDDNNPTGDGGAITINGGNVTATGPHDYVSIPGIGGAYGDDRTGSNGSLTISSADVLAKDTVLGSGGNYTINGDPTDAMIVVPDGLVYTGKPLDLDGKIYIDVTKTSTESHFGQNFTVKASADGWVLQDLDEVVNAGTYTATFKNGSKSISKDFTVAQSGTEFDGKLIVRNGDKETTEFTVSDTITVIATPKATGQAPANGAMLAADLAVPTGGQMALYVGDTQVSGAVDAVDGSYTMTVSAADVLALGQVELGKVELTAKFIENDNQTGADATVAVTITAAVKVEKNGAATYYDNFETAWEVAKGGESIITLLADVEVEAPLRINDTQDKGADITLNGGSYTIGISAGEYVHGIIMHGGKLTINSGNIIIKSGLYVAAVEGGELIVNGGTFKGMLAGVGKGAYGIVRLRGGTFAGNEVWDNAVINSSGKVMELLGHTDTTRYAFYENGKPVALDEETRFLTGTVTVAECKHEASVCKYTHTDDTTTHSMTCLACGKVWDAKNCRYTFTDNVGTCQDCQSKLTVTVTGTDGLTYDGTAKSLSISVTVDGQTLDASNYTVSYSDNISAGENTVTVTGKDGAWSYEQKFTIAPALLTIKANDQTITYGNSITLGAGQATATGLCTGDTLNGITLTPSSNQVSVENKTIAPSAAQIQNNSGEDVTANYKITYQEGKLTINRAEGKLTVLETQITKTFGDGEFLLNCSSNSDGKISYTSSDENVASVSEGGTVLIKSAGEATITVSLGEGTNHTGGAEQEIRLTVTKAGAPAIITETRNYAYLNGSGGPVTIDIAGKLPGDRGKTEYTYTKEDTEGILSGVSVDADGNLVYTVQGNKKIGDTASITVTAEMANYETATFTVEIVLVKKKTVEPQVGSSVSADGVLIYGQRLSELKLTDVVFVEQGTGEKVEGTLTWKDSSSIPDVKTTAAEWIFTPVNSSEYVEMTGTVSIKVAKATPDVEIPVAETIIYNPSGKLGSVALSGGSATWTVGGSTKTVEGAWGWQSADTVPTVDNSGYAAVFTPDDTENYETVEKTVTVQVTKAAPYIADQPKASEITYGDALGASVLSGGIVQYGDGKGQAGSGTGSGQAVQGTFTWENACRKTHSG